MNEAQPTIPSVEETFCVNHPQVATSLRCNRCGNPICVRCAVRTPVGYRCKTCVKGQQSAFYTAAPSDYVIAAIITLPLAALGQFIGPMLWFFALFAGPIVGGVIADLVWRATGKRRGQYTWLVVAASMVVAALPAVAWALVTSGLVGLLWHGIYLVLAVGAAIARLRYGT
jgi:hypothetical protein